MFGLVPRIFLKTLDRLYALVPRYKRPIGIHRDYRLIVIGFRFLRLGKFRNLWSSHFVGTFKSFFDILLYKILFRQNFLNILCGFFYSDFAIVFGILTINGSTGFTLFLRIDSWLESKSASYRTIVLFLNLVFQSDLLKLLSKLLYQKILFYFSRLMGLQLLL